MARTLSVLGPVPKGTRKFVIEISTGLKKFPSVTVQTLIHECVHVEQWDKVTERTQHGNLFNARMKQLANLGAFRGLW